jgi:lysyl-tRNA synthetase class 2
MEPHLNAFELCTTHHRKQDPFYLHTSPEYHMKRALAVLNAPIFQIARCFRDEPESPHHQPEFTMLEWYRVQADYLDLMSDCESLIQTLVEALFADTFIEINSKQISLEPPYERITVQNAMKKWANLDPFALDSPELFAQAAQLEGLNIPESWPWEDMFHFVLIERIEPHLGQDRPTFLYNYPPSLAALSKVNNAVAERVELYIAGVELANGFSELTDSEEQRTRFMKEQKLRSKLNKTVYPIDERLLEALDQLQPSAGIALGLDRLWLLFASHFVKRPVTLKEVLWTAP